MNANLFKSILSTMKPITLEPTMYVVGKSEGLRVLTTDPAKVIGLNLLLHKANFEIFELDKSVEKFTFSLEKLINTVDNIGHEDTVELDIFSDSLELKIAGSQKRRFKIELLNTTEEKPKGVPNYTYTAKAKLMTKGLEIACNDVSKFTDTISFKVLSNGLVIGGADGSCENELIKGLSTNLLDFSTSKEFTVSFTNEFLYNVISASKAFSDIVEVELDEISPIHLHFITTHPIRLEYWIAPRVS